MSDPFIGEIRMLPYTYSPRDWAVCDGQLLSISENTALFSIIGTIYGGDGRTTMGVPNLTGRSPMHPGRGPGLSARAEGQRIGNNSITLTDPNLPIHNHAVSGIRRAGTTNEPDNTMFPATDKDINIHEYIRDSSNLASMSSAALTTTGGGRAHENRQPFLVMQFCIALDGIYPPRS